MAHAKTLARLHGGKSVTPDQVREWLRYIATEEYPSLRACARTWGVSVPYLSDAVSGRRSIGPSLLNKLGLRKQVVVSYVRTA